ncbi:glutamate--tRNA ligase [candidate division KSB1 bacterium]
MNNITDKNVRVRFAPSPTGQLHIGNVRTAILNWLCARHYNGSFVLRIEDTDAERSTKESEKSIVEQLKWLGLDWDEGPEKGGEFGPYRQSERIDLYNGHVARLLSEGLAYSCYCTEEELEQEREKALAEKRSIGYSGKCRHLTSGQREAFEKEGRKPAIRFKVPSGGVSFSDLVQGEKVFDSEVLSDFVIQRNDGSSPYNFAAVVDDNAMEITHVIRGDDHVSNTARQVLLYQAFGYRVPYFAHIPMILGQDGTRLSKRHGHTSVVEFQIAGYLPAALLNFLSLLSWSSETGDEILSAERLIDEFDFSRMSRSPAKFDPVKLNWMNGMYIRALSPEQRETLAMPFFQNAGLEEHEAERYRKIIEAVKDRVETLSEFPEKAGFFFADTITVEGENEREILQQESARQIFRLLIEQLGNVSELTVPVFQSVMKTVQKETGIKGKDLWMPVRVALTGQMHGPELPLVLEILGRERCIGFLESVIT